MIRVMDLAGMMWVGIPINPVAGLKLEAQETSPAQPCRRNTHQPSRGIETIVYGQP